MRILLLGGAGQIGQEFRGLPFPDSVEIAAPSRSTLDLEDPQELARIIAAEPWDVVINAAAYTDVDQAEMEQAKAFAINAEAPSRLAVETERHGIPLIHISTDYVFNGRKGTPYLEQDQVEPLNVYGHSKLAGECGVSAANPRHVILRTSWVYSPYRKNFVRTILRLAAERDRLTIVDDQRGCPTAALDIAKACLDIALRCATKPEETPYGIYHYTGASEATWFEFAKVIVDLAGDRLGRRPQVVPIPTIDYPTPARRAADTRLDCSRIVGVYGIKLRPWREALAETIDRLLSNRGAP